MNLLLEQVGAGSNPLIQTILYKRAAKERPLFSFASGPALVQRLPPRKD
jgi:hypothetical protein